MEQNKLRCSWCQYHIHEGVDYKMELIDRVDVKTDEVYNGEFKWYKLKEE